MDTPEKAWRHNAQTAVRILHVDDEPAVLNALKRNLRKEGFEVISVQNGYAAMLLAQDIKFDLAILDMAMPGLDGLSLLGQLRSIDPELKAISLTGMTNNQVLYQAIEAGFDGYLEKPYDIDWLGREIHHVLHTQPERKHV